VAALPGAGLRAAVVGGGSMGSGIAEVTAEAGAQVTVVVPSTLSAGATERRLRRSLDRQVERGRRTGPQRDATLARIEVSTDLTAVAACDVVIEAIREDEAGKREVFAQIDKVVTGERAVLASTTSGIPIGRLARATTRPGRVVGLHFFSPVPAQALVEVVPAALTEPGTLERATHFVGTVLGKTPLTVPDRAGFLVNTLLVPYLLAAIRAVETGVATASDVDLGMTLGCSHPVGPLRLADLIGLDVICGVAEAMYAEFRDPAYAPPPLLLRKVEAGQLGKKTGTGFHRYG